MRSRSSSKSMEVEREEQPHLSGAYIRSLVKHLSHSSRAKGGHDSTMKSPENENGDKNPKNNNTAEATQGPVNNGANEGGKREENKVAQPYKKQVRRRLHTTRPYQERLLNMAEARREIVTALKIHRAAMKQAKEKEQQQQQKQMQLQQQLLQQPQTLSPSNNDPLFEPYKEYPFNYSNFSNYLCNTEVSPFAYTSFSWPQPIIAPISPIFNNFNLDLPFPSQPLGLNLNFQGFNSIDSTLPSQPLAFSKPITQSSPTTSSNYSHSYSSPTTQNYEASKLHQNETSVSLHPVMDEEEIAEIYSLGEKHDIEWNDTVNLVTSAWWSKFLKNLEEGQGESMEGIERHESHDVLNGGNLDKSLWLDASFGQENNGGFFDDQQHFGCYQAEYSDEVALPRLDIGEIEGWDGEWLS
ncbi:hypothetical protein LUZ60_006565 [Juncus effusus]|nr:hypothetical protein LUZ60_006565 [Juncus effusus]